MPPESDGKTTDEPDSVRVGGLMRCCLETLDGLYPDGPGRMATEGQELQCKFSDSPNHHMIFRAGAWEWDRRPV